MEKQLQTVPEINSYDQGSKNKQDNKTENQTSTLDSILSHLDDYIQENMFEISNTSLVSKIVRNLDYFHASTDDILMRCECAIKILIYFIEDYTGENFRLRISQTKKSSKLLEKAKEQEDNAGSKFAGVDQLKSYLRNIL